MPTWTPTPPAESGHYWYRWPNDEPQIGYWDAEMQWLASIGNDVGIDGSDLADLRIEFHPEPILPPAA